MDSAALARLVDQVGTYRQDSLLVIRHGKIVVDAYYAPYAPNTRHDLRSVTKSFIGTLTAIEVKEGLLDSVDHPIVDLFADKHLLNVDDAKKAITVQTMLDMNPVWPGMRMPTRPTNRSVGCTKAPIRRNSC
jgi:CubicO group peptidase (beta-lactamase class C family)